jgi:hypothetical protein
MLGRRSSVLMLESLRRKVNGLTSRKVEVTGHPVLGAVQIAFPSRGPQQAPITAGSPQRADVARCGVPLRLMGCKRPLHPWPEACSQTFPMVVLPPAEGQ